MSKSITVPQNTPISDETKAELARELAKLRSKANKDLSLADFKHLQKVEWIGRFCTLLGYGTAWIVPNPISAFLISMGNFNRWANIAHPVSHGGYDKIKGVPKRYTSKHFAQGYRRMIDWPDWMLPAGWHQEHNQLHHYRLGENEDPDQVERNLEWLRESKLPMWVRYTIVALFACVWKPVYYAQSTLKELRVIRAEKEGRDPSEVPSSMNIKVWSPFYKEGREYWGQCILPYAGLRFIVIPALFFPLGGAAVSSVFFTSLLAEVFTNLHSFLVIVPNHSGDDIVRFKNPTNDRKEYYYRQIVGSVNFPVGSDLNDILHGWLNYQIEHHLWPTLPLSQYQKLQPEVKALCDKYGVPYRQESVFRRLKKVADIMTGKTSMLWEVETAETQETQRHEELKSADA